MANKSTIATTNLSQIIFNLLFSIKGAIGKGGGRPIYFEWYSVITGIAEQVPKKFGDPMIDSLSESYRDVIRVIGEDPEQEGL